MGYSSPFSGLMIDWRRNIGIRFGQNKENTSLKVPPNIKKLGNQLIQSGSKVSCLLLWLVLSEGIVGQPIDSLQLDGPRRLRTVIATEVLLYTGTMVALDQLWYRDYPRQSFHSFNDNGQWLQMDKVGHAMTTYYVGLLGMDSYRWAGMDEKRSRYWGGATGWLFLSTVEIFDGFSEEWGFSWGDFGANTMGAAMLIGQDAAWGEQRITFKFSFRESPYAQLRPGTLGDGWHEEVLKDYNGQTYWLSANVKSFLQEESKFPDWLSLAVGYGVDQQVVGEGVYIRQTDDGFRRLAGVRQFYMAPEVDLWRIQTESKVLRTVFRTIGFIKLPLPALVLQNGKLRSQGFRF